MNKMLKIEKVDKQLVFLLIFISVFLLEVSLASINTIHPLPSLVFYLPLYATLLYIISVYLVRNLIYHYRVMYMYILIVFFIANILYAYFLVSVGMMQGGIVMWMIFTFMGLFYGTFLWDFFMGLPYLRKVLDVFQKRVNKHLQKNTNDNEILINGRNFFKLDVERDRKSILMIVLGIFVLPFALLGKGAAYFLGIGLSQYFDAHAYVISVLSFPGTLFFFTLFTPPTVALWRLKYPNE